MRRRVMICVISAVAFAAVVWVGGGRTVAAADPDSQLPQCTYQLTPPQVVPVSGVSMVTVSVNPVGCSGIASIYRTTACVKSADDNTVGTCAEITGFRSAQVFYPYRPGTTYTATGRGCADLYVPSTVVSCDSLGPISTAL